MPDHLSQRITQLRDLVRQGLHQDNLDKMVRECNSLAQDSPHVLFFFTLKTVFREMSDAMENEAVDASRYLELTQSISKQTAELLEKLNATGSVAWSDMEELTRIHLVNLNLFKN